MTFRFLDFEVYEACREVRRAARPVPTEPKAFDLIVLLLRERRRVVSKREILDALWPGEDVFENVLTSCVYRARQSLGRAALGQTLIRNVPRVGYRFAGDVLEPLAGDTGTRVVVSGLAAAAEVEARSIFSMLDFEGAAAAFARAIDLIEREHPGDVAWQARLLFARGEALSRAGRAEAARDAFRLADLRFKAAGARTAHRQEGPDSVFAESERFLTLLGAGIGLVDLCPEESRAANMAERHRVLEATADRARLDGDLGSLASARVNQRWLAFASSPTTDRLDMSLEAIQLAEAAGAPDLLQDARLLYIHDLFENGKFDETRDQIERYAERAASLDAPICSWIAGYLAATRALMDGRLTESEHLAMQALGRGAPRSPEQSTAVFTTQLLAVKAQQGRVGELTGLMEMFVFRYPNQPIGHALLANAYCEAGRLDDARRAMATAAEVDREANGLRISHSPFTIASLALACAALVDSACASALSEMLRPWSGKNIVLSPAIACIGPVDGFLGMLARTAGDFAAADRYFTSALRDCIRMGSEPLLARVRLEHGRNQLAQGRRVEARDSFSEAARIARAHDLSGVLTWAEGALADRDAVHLDPGERPS